jgi:hypothetical protein
VVEVLSLLIACAGMLDSDEFALAMHLMNIKLDGNEILLIDFFPFGPFPFFVPGFVLFTFCFC